MRRLEDERGFTIVEVVIATAILLTGVLGTLAMMGAANRHTRNAGDRQIVTNVVRDVLESVRSIPYKHVDQDEVVARLRALEGLEGSPGGAGWRIERGTTRIALDVEVCALDDPADGSGSHAAGGFCEDAGVAGSADGSPQDHKRVTVTASWANGAGTGKVTQSTLVSARGNDDAPIVDSLTMTSPASTTITSTSVTKASFAVTTSVDPESVVWTLDGVQQGVVGGSGTSFGFDWTLPAADGRYLVGAQAFDVAGAAGADKSITVTVNRYAPAAPRHFNAGRNGSVVEAEWQASSERDVIEYRVYRQAGSAAATVVCKTTSATSCVDSSPPSASGTLRYWVVALDGTIAAPRAGAASAAVDVNVPNSAPNAPARLTLSRDASGRAVLSWTVPSPGDPDAGDSIGSFRIYRDGTAVTNRSARPGGGESTWTDGDSAGAAHRYWITAVDSRLRESALVGPVGG